MKVAAKAPRCSFGRCVSPRPHGACLSDVGRARKSALAARWTIVPLADEIRKLSSWRRTLSENHAQQPEVEATKATAHLPGLDIEIVHRRSRGGDAEQISINLQAVPSFEAFGRLVESTNPFAFWTQVMQAAWLPWLAAAQVILPAGMTLPRVGLEATTPSSDTAHPPQLR